MTDQNKKHIHQSEFAIDTRKLNRQAGSMLDVTCGVLAPADCTVDVIGVPEGSPMTCQVRLEAVTEGILISGTVNSTAMGECSRCLDKIELPTQARFVELFVYPGSTTEDTDADALRLDGDYIDLEPIVRDAVVLELPLNPLCRADCEGMCSGCGQRWENLPDSHSHDELDPRWADLSQWSESSDSH